MKRQTTLSTPNPPDKTHSTYIHNIQTPIQIELMSGTLPGLTGLAQVKGRNAVDWETRLKWDVRYVETATFQKDAEILWQTFTLLGKGEGTNCSSEFLGTEKDRH